MSSKTEIMAATLERIATAIMFPSDDEDNRLSAYNDFMTMLGVLTEHPALEEDLHWKAELKTAATDYLNNYVSGMNG